MFTGEMMQDEFAVRLTALRKEQGWTQEELAEKCGISRQAVAKWEGGKSLPDVFRIVELANLFQVDVGDILPDTDSNLNLRFCLEAIGDFFRGAVIIDATHNTYTYVKTESVLGKIPNIKGNYDDLFERASKAIPEANHRLEFIKRFRRDNLIKQYEEGVKTVSLDHRVINDEGEHHWVMNTACFIRHVKTDSVIVVSFESIIDQYKEMEEKSRQEIVERQAIINVLSNEYDAVFLSNLDTGKVLYAFINDTAAIDKGAYEVVENFKNCFSDELDEMHRQLVHPDDIEQFKKSISRQYVTDMLNKYNSFACNYRMIFGDKTVHYQTRFVRALDFETSHNYIVGAHSIESFYQDVARTQNELAKAVDTIKEGEEEKNNLITQLSHDIRIPLNSIMGFLKLAEESGKPDEKEYYIRMATEACDNMASVLNNVIDLVSPGSDNVILKKQDRTIKQLLNRLINSSNSDAKKFGFDGINSSAEDEDDKKTSMTKLQGKRILLAEDTEANAMVTSAFLREWGVEMIRAHDGKEAVDIVSKSPIKEFDAILMDVQMPNMDGYEATKLIRKLPNKASAGIPIIALTASVFDEDKKAAKDAGMNAHLCKPFTPKQLYDKIVAEV